jgi:peptidyl-prolyl cis-trans isomerase B (cyclophilin B)
MKNSYVTVEVRMKFGIAKRVFWGLSLISTLMICTNLIAEEEKMQFNEPTKPLVFEQGKSYQTIIHTSKGDIICELNSKETPLSVTNFIQLAQGGFYNGLTFHRVVSNFVVQGGDPEGTGRGGPGYTIPAEIKLPHVQGALAWARLPDNVNPKKRSSGSQFYITLEKIAYLDGEYTVFGQTVSGFEVVQKIEQGDVIKSIDIIIK